LADRWILESLSKTILSVDKYIEEMNFSLAADELNDFTWNKLADWYLEIAKIEKDKSVILLYILKKILILWHPFIPFVSEKIWSVFNNSLLIVAKWPEVIENKETGNNNNKNNFSTIQEVVVAIRNARSENKIEPAKKLSAVIYAYDVQDFLQKNASLIKNLKTGIESLEIKTEGEKIPEAILVISGKIEIYLLGALDKEKEMARLLKEKELLEKLIDIQIKKLANEEFVSRAPEKIVLVEKEKLTSYKNDVERIIQALKQL